MANILTAASDVLAKLVSLSSDSSKWSSETWTAFGDWASKQAPELSYDSTIDKKNIPKTAGTIGVFVGFNFREVTAGGDRCSAEYLYPIGIGIYQRFRATGVTTPAGLVTKVDPTVLADFMRLSEDLEDNLYAQGISSTFGYDSHESFFDHETLKDQYLKQVFIFRYREK